MESLAKSIEAEIFMEGLNTFAVLDGASVPGLLEKLDQWQPEFVCLYRGELEPDLAEVAPYLVRLEAGTKFTAWVLSEGWGNHWGIFALADLDLQAMRQHLRRLLTVYDESGKPLLFRFYDPRVMRMYVPTCQPEELAGIFGSVASYILEDENPNICLRFQANDGKLITQPQALARN